MNKPEPPIESLRNLLPKTEPRPSRNKEDDFVPRYVELPPRSRDIGTRNLQWGAATLILAFLLLGLGIFFGGARAVVPVLICLATITILWMAARLRLFQQRNGLFLVLGIVSLLGALVPIFEHAWRVASHRVRVVSLESTAPSKAASSVEPGAEEQPPLLTKELGIAPPTGENERLVKVLKDSRVLVGRKPYLIKAGEVFSLDSVKEGEVVFRAQELRLSLPDDAVEMLDPASDSTAPGPAASSGPRRIPGSMAQATQRAQHEAVRRYPALGAKDSPENKLFLQTYRDLKESKSELLDDPQWPLVVANLLAKREGWEGPEGPQGPEGR